MAKIFLSALLILFTVTSAHHESRGSWQRGQCQIDSINAQEPSYRVQAEGGESEFWDHNSQEFQCAGVAFHRHRLRQKALMLPAYHNAPVLAYIVQGRGIFGQVISGCAETYESSQESQEFEGEHSAGEREGGRSEREGGRGEREGGRSEREGGRSEREGGRGEREGGRSEREGGRSEREGGRSEREGERSEREGGRSEREGGRSEREGGRGGERRFWDRHQKVGHFRQGDIIAIPAGAAHWAYNSGDEELVVVVLQDTGNAVNQLDQNPRSFFLAGNPGGEQGQQQWQGRQKRGERGQRGGEHGQRGGESGQVEFGNVFRGFDTQILADIFRVDEETARKLRGEDDNRGHLVIVERSLQVLSPPLRGEEGYGRREEKHGRGEEEFGRRGEKYGRGEEEFGRRGEKYGRGEEGSSPYYGSRDNGLEETICTARSRENIDRPSRADIYNPRAGRFTTSNSLTLPILRFLDLSAARGILYRNSIMSPHWTVNAHSIVYVTRGEARVQIVNHRGQAVLDSQVREGQVFVVPQNFAVVKRASDEGFEWVEFNTNHRAMINTLSGRTSAIRGLPAAVVAAAYQLPREDAERLKFSRRETFFFSGSSSRSGRGEGRVAAA